MLLMGLPETGWAEAMQFAYSNSMSMSYDTNPNMSQTRPKGTWRVSAKPRLNLDSRIGRDDYSANASLYLEHSGDTVLSGDRVDPDLSLTWFRDGPTASFGLSAAYQTASTRVTELADTGLVSADQTRSTASLSANYVKQFSELLSLGANAGYSQVGYSGTGSLVDYSTFSSGLTLTRAISDRISVHAGVSTTRYAPRQGTASSSSSGTIGTNMSVSNRLTASVHVGVNHASTTRKYGLIGGAAINYDLGERSALSASVDHSVTPSGIGSFAKSSLVTGLWTYGLSERLFVSSNASWRKDYSGAKPLTKQFGVGLDDVFDNAWRLRLSYEYRSIDQPGPGNAEGHQFFVTLAYANPHLL
jgi:hypothetical protein